MEDVEKAATLLTDRFELSETNKSGRDQQAAYNKGIESLRYALIERAGEEGNNAAHLDTGETGGFLSDWHKPKDREQP